MNAFYLPFWVGGLLLASVPVLHWFTLRRTLAVSGRFSALVDRARHGEAEPAPDESALLEAIRAATAMTFGSESLEAMPGESSGVETATPRPHESVTTHAAFLLGLVLGGLGSALLRGVPEITTSLHGALWLQTFGGGAGGYAALFIGGMLVGGGTRMAGGCTSGHGLCGLSQRQLGSFIATCAFFGAGILVSLLLEVVS